MGYKFNPLAQVGLDLQADVDVSVVDDLAVQGTLSLGNFTSRTNTGAGFLSTTNDNLIRWVGGSAFEVRGIIGDQIEGAMVLVVNDSSNSSLITFTHENILSNVLNQIDTIHENDIVLGRGDSIAMYYDTGTDKYTVYEVNRSSDIVNTPTQVAGTGGKVTVETTSMVSGNGNMVASAGNFQLQDSTGTTGLVQVHNGALITSDAITKRQEGFSLIWTVATNWLFNSASNVEAAIVKVSMMATDPTKTVTLKGGSYRGYVVQVFMTEHPNHFAAFTVLAPGFIEGYANGIVISSKGDSVTFRQTASSDYVVECANFDITPQKA